MTFPTFTAAEVAAKLGAPDLPEDQAKIVLGRLVAWSVDIRAAASVIERGKTTPAMCDLALKLRPALLALDREAAKAIRDQLDDMVDFEHGPVNRLAEALKSATIAVEHWSTTRWVDEVIAGAIDHVGAVNEVILKRKKAPRPLRRETAALVMDDILYPPNSLHD